MQSSETIEQPEPSLQEQFDAWQADVARSEAFLQPIDPMERSNRQGMLDGSSSVSLEPEFAI